MVAAPNHCLASYKRDTSMGTGVLRGLQRLFIHTSVSPSYDDHPDVAKRIADFHRELQWTTSEECVRGPSLGNGRYSLCPHQRSHQYIRGRCLSYGLYLVRNQLFQQVLSVPRDKHVDFIGYALQWTAALHSHHE